MTFLVAIKNIDLKYQFDHIYHQPQKSDKLKQEAICKFFNNSNCHEERFLTYCLTDLGKEDVEEFLA